MRALAVQTVFTALDKMRGPMATMSSGIGRFAAGANRATGIARSGFAGLRSMIGIVAGALAGGAVVKAISDFAARGDDISDVSKRIGLSAEALQEFQYAGKAADISAEDLTGIFQKMNNNLGQLKTGTGALYATLKKTNPQLAIQLRHAKDSEEAFSLLMDAIAKESDIQKRAALSQAAFGKSGQAIIDMAGDLAEKRKEAHDMGAVQTAQEIAAGTRLHNSLLETKAILAGIANTVLGKLAQSLGPILEKFNQWIQANRQFIGQNIGMVFKVIGDVFTQLGPSIAGVVAKLLPAIMRLVNVALPVLVDLLDTLLPILDPLLALLDPILDIFMALAPGIKAAAEAVKSILVPALEILRPLLELIAIILKPIVEAGAWLTKGIGNLEGGVLGKLAGLFPKAGDAGAASPVVSPNLGVIASNVTTTRNSTLDVNFNNTPADTSTRQRGRAPGITINMGPTMASGMAH